jgi:hypothetical protein
MQFPHIHLNGTAAASLFDAYVDAMEAANKLERALEATHPNGRDYYPISEGAISVATAEHVERLKAVRKIFIEMEALALYVQEQGGL